MGVEHDRMPTNAAAPPVVPGSRCGGHDGESAERQSGGSGGAWAVAASQRRGSSVSATESGTS